MPRGTLQWLAAEIDEPAGHVRSIARGVAMCSPTLAAKISAVTEGVVSVEELVRDRKPNPLLREGSWTRRRTRENDIYRCARCDTIHEGAPPIRLNAYVVMKSDAGREAGSTRYLCPNCKVAFDEFMQAFPEGKNGA